MHAVGNVADGNLVLRLAADTARPHRAGHLAVQRRNGVGAPRQLQAQHGHAELFVTIVRMFSRPSAMKPFVRKTQLLAQRAEVLLDEARVEPVVTRRARAYGW